MMHCDEFAALWTEQAEGQLPTGKRLSWRAHGLMCGKCRRFARQMVECVALTAALAEPAAPPDPQTQEALLAAFREREEQGQG